MQPLPPEAVEEEVVEHQLSRCPRFHSYNLRVIKRAPHREQIERNVGRNRAPKYRRKGHAPAFPVALAERRADDCVRGGIQGETSVPGSEGGGRLEPLIERSALYLSSLRFCHLKKSLLHPRE